MKKVALTLFAVIMATGLWAQPLCPVKEGVSLTYVMKNAKGKPQSYAKQTVTSVSGSGNNLQVTYTSEALDKKMKSMPKVPVISYTYNVENGAVIIDPKALLNSVSASPTDGTAEGTPMVLPANIQAGDAMPDCEMKMKIAFINISASYTEGACEGNETITTEAGTFDCKKVKFRCKGSAMGIKTDMYVYSWYAPGIGIVKQDIYTVKGKLNSSQELIELIG